MFLLRRVVGSSMIPAVRPGGIVVFWRHKRVRPGSVVIATVNGREVIKRVSELQDGRAYLLGDNPSASTDSRDFGWIDESLIRGVAIWGVAGV